MSYESQVLKRSGMTGEMEVIRETVVLTKADLVEANINIDPLDERWFKTTSIANAEWALAETILFIDKDYIIPLKCRFAGLQVGKRYVAESQKD